eukprot:scaffold290970_cov24-Tisochrysis_lutea.AAC.1
MPHNRLTCFSPTTPSLTLCAPTAPSKRISSLESRIFRTSPPFVEICVQPVCHSPRLPGPFLSCSVLQNSPLTARHPLRRHRPAPLLCLASVSPVAPLLRLCRPCRQRAPAWPTA